MRISYKMMSGPNLKVEPDFALEPMFTKSRVPLSEDMFTKNCVPLLDDLFKQIPAQESKMWKDQYGSVFGVKQ